MKKIVARAALASALLLGGAGAAQAQSACSFIAPGAILTAGQWNGCFAAKNDALGYNPVNKAGDTMSGRLIFVTPTTGGSSINLPHGVAPSSPINGDVWTTTGGIFVQINGVTVGPLTGPSGGSFAGTAPITVSFPAGVVTYALTTPLASQYGGTGVNNGASTITLGGSLTLPAAADFSATGGAHKVIFQTSLGGAFTVAQPTVSDLANVSGGTILSNNSSTSGPVIAAIQPALALSTAPTTPGAGFETFWSDTTDLRFHDKNSAGTIGTTVVSSSCAANQFGNAISAAGVFSCAQPTVANLANIAGGTVLANASGSSGAVTATIAPVLGITGVSVGSIGFNNASSGTLTLQAVTGGLASTVLLLPTSGGSDTLVTKASLDTLTNKTYDTAGTGNAFKINGTAITAVTGTGAVVLADSPVHTTLLTSPVLAGGSAASSTLVLESTSGAGTTDKIQFKTASQAVRGTVLSNGNLGWGTETNPQNAITLSKNVATGLAGGGGYATIFGLDNDFPSLYVINFANGGGTFPIVGFKSAQGIGSAFTSSLSGDVLGSFSAVGASANNTFPGSNTGLVQFVAEENWNSTNQGTKILFVTTPKLSTGGARATALTAWGSSGVSISTGADPGANNFGAPGSILSTGPTSGVGYATGAGGTITQITTRSTGVTLNKVSGAITLVSAAGSTTPATFVLTNSAIAATDVVVINQKSGTDKYEIFITAVAAGSCAVTFFTTGGTTTEQPVFNFAVIKGVAS